MRRVWRCDEQDGDIITRDDDEIEGPKTAGMKSQRTKHDAPAHTTPYHVPHTYLVRAVAHNV